MFNYKFKYFIVCFLVILSSQALGFYTESISSFESYIKINKDRSINIKEKITYSLKAQLNKHLLFRDFPTRYTDKYGNNYIVEFKINNILKDGEKVPFKIENLQNGKRILIGSLDKTLVPGEHIYVINYTTNRQLGFFENHDEFYWNVTGTGWSLPIIKTSAFIKLPKEIPISKVDLEGYTGYQDLQEKNYTSFINNKNQIVFQTTKPLLPNQGLTVVVSWPKGYIQPPTVIEKLKYLFFDNLSLLWLIIGLIILFIFYIINFIKIRKKQKTDIIIPLFEPPKNLSAGAVRYIYNFGFDSKVFAAEIVEMAVKNLITIDFKKGKLFSSDTYTIKKVSQESENIPENISDNILIEHKALLDSLFKYSQEVSLTKANSDIVSKTLNKLANYFSNIYGQKYFDFNTETLVWGVIISCFFIAPSFFFSVYLFNNLIAYILIAAYIITIIAFYYLLKDYTPEGREILNKIKGFRLFLSVTETERLKIIGTPPTKTPELFEKYLPYAIALGVEEQWSKQFAPVFARLEKVEHKKYQPDWISGPIQFAYLSAFSYNLSNSLNAAVLSTVRTTIPSSGLPPGSSSGSGGRGSSGGGGGGGGGGTL